MKTAKNTVTITEIDGIEVVQLNGQRAFFSFLTISKYYDISPKKARAIYEKFKESHNIRVRFIDNVFVVHVLDFNRAWIDYMESQGFFTR